MSHKVNVKKLAKLRRDGTVIEGKYEYLVTCKSRHGKCYSERFTSSAVAEGAKAAHHAEAQQKHIEKNPTDCQVKTTPTPSRPKRKKEDVWL